MVIKLKSDDALDKYKARLVPKWFNRVVGIDHSETFSPVKPQTIQMVLSLALSQNWPIK